MRPDILRYTAFGVFDYSITLCELNKQKPFSRYGLKEDARVRL